MKLERLRRKLFGHRADDRGFVIAVFALALTALLTFAGFSIDVGSWYAHGSKAQRAADAAALAGVVWMPNEEKAGEAVIAAAERNGFVESDDIDITWGAPPTGNNRQLEVTITERRIDQYFSKLVLDQVDITRSATAEYVLPVPLGSPRNFLGTGDLDTGYGDNLWLAVSTWCTNKNDGERYQARNGGVGTSYSPGECVANPAPGDPDLNHEYRPGGYEFYIEAPEGRGYNLDVLLFDPRYRTGGVGDSGLHGAGTNHDYTYTLYSADDSALDDSDNPPVPGCSGTYSRTTNQNYGSYLGEDEWVRLCQIEPSDPSGRYILRVHNTPNELGTGGSNIFSIVARPSSGFGWNGLCDGRTAPMCPRVYGKDALPVFAKDDGLEAEFYLAEVEPVHAGKTMRITLFDPGEGGDWIEILQPTGSNSWTPVDFSWTSDSGSHPSGSGTQLDVGPDRDAGWFDGRTVTLEVDLGGYSPPADNNWWRIRYRFHDDPGESVTDRTTWSVNIIGDPVHLID